MHKHNCHSSHSVPKKAYPLVAVGAFIQLFALIDVIRSSDFKVGNKALWIMMVFVVPPFGPIAYYLLGREK
ncbi:PLD nuclease N-terminal domain-containing protein [Paucilactobacillus suebicus]|uniref:PLD nuclease N-terminal domain-containing protein n=1 Tax=Paucilactobacillus suebicus TaxID=152335 RepID=UPI000249051A|nr:PLD nuclease N-terminal domain-containing protein [Paucilactobacillus suebicus]